MEQIIAFLSRLDLTYIYLAVFLAAYIENLFPPFPSDVLVVFCGSLIAIDQGSVPIVLLSSTLGSTLGFITMYKIGDAFGLKILERGKLKFIPLDSVHKVENWFRHYGYWIIVLNRFLAGTRAVISFFAGMSELRFPVTILLSAASALVWNAILIYFGFTLGDNWRGIGGYMSLYSKTITVILFLLLAGWILWRTLIKPRLKKAE